MECHSIERALGVGIDGHAAAPHVGLHAITGSGILTHGRSWSRFS
jgi:hypothetical protein